MLLNISKLSIAGLALMSASALASVSTASFGSASNDNNNQFHVVKDGVTVTVSGWSDNSDFASNPATGDDKINAAKKIERYGSGWGITNQDPDGHTADNFRGSSSTDYDMFLLEFSSAVSLSKATYSWVDNHRDVTDVTVAAINTNNLDGKSWSTIASASHNLGSESLGMQGSNSSGSGSYYTDISIGASSKFWLIGALNAAFGPVGTHDDGFKLSGITFSKSVTPPPPTTSVPEPSSIAILGLALLGFAARRKIK